MINEFIVINVMNEAMIKTLSEKKMNCDKNLKIREFLKDEAFFFKVDKKNAYEILRNVGIMEENIGSVYEKLVAPNMFYGLINKGKISKDDNNLTVRYDEFNGYDNLFKKKTNK